MRINPRLYSFALWMHIPMWIAASIVIVLMGAYNAGAQQNIVKDTVVEVESIYLPILTLEQLQQITVSDL